MREASVRKRKKDKAPGSVDAEGPKQLQLVSLQDAAQAGYELADVVLERERIEEAKGLYLRRQRARLKELDTKAKELSIALNARQDGPKEVPRPQAAQA